MKCILVLSMENLSLAVAEACSLLGIKRYVLDNNLLVADIPKSSLRLAKRLAYTTSVYSLLFDSDKKSVLKKAKRFNWQKIYRKSFCVRLRNCTASNVLTEKDFASIIWNSIKKPVVNLEGPGTWIEFFFAKKVYCGLLIFKNKESFEARKPQHRPGFSPVSLHPKLARALVNLSGAKKGVICDPFCGSGGILIEAGLMGLKPVGFDIDYGMVIKSKKNLSFYGIKNASVSKEDATKVKKKFPFIVTDLPYGQSSYKTAEIKILYSQFLSRLKKILAKKSVIVFPDKVNYRSLVKSARLKISSENSYYIHKSLTKKIVVLCK